MIYLDNSATTPMSETAIHTLLTVSQTTFGNPSSLHTPGRQAAQILRNARHSIASALETSPNRIIFTSGGTEADNLALIGYTLANIEKGKHILTTAIEHHAVLHPLKELEQKYGFEVTYLKPVEGRYTVQQFKEALRPDTILVSAMYANNETGYLLPIASIGELLKEHQAVFHVDAVQAVGKLPIHPEELGIDLLSASGHKFHGPKGVGFLYTNTNRLHPLLLGGNQEDKRRASTENLASIASMASALEESLASWETNMVHVQQLRRALLTALSPLGPTVNQDQDNLPYVLNIAFPGQLNEQLLMRLDLLGISISSGSACTAGNIEPSHVLEALYGAEHPLLKESVRISFSKYNTLEEIDTLSSQLLKLLGE
ncbi:cysteine desulfurase family protein [Streptococcus rifensis]